MNKVTLTQVQSNDYKFYSPRDVETKPVEPSLLAKDDCLDAVTISSKSSEKFEDILAELRANVPDRTSTIEEKELAISYIDRMLACDDIPEDAKTFWTYNKTIIQAEIQAIKNENASGDEKFEDVLKELDEFVENYRRSEPKNFLTVQDRTNYWRTYNNTCISFYQRALNASDINDETRAYCVRMINEHKRDNNNLQVDLNNYNKENGLQTESFLDVFKEFLYNVPDVTTTIDEKELALSYIERMLSCDDIPDYLLTYWQDRKEVIKSEISNFNK